MNEETEPASVDTEETEPEYFFNIWQMYAAQPTPEKLALNEYFVRYCETGDPRFIAAFLHYYEPKLNKLARSVCSANECLSLLEDAKQAVVETIWKCAMNYDPASDVLFLVYVKPYIEEAWRNFLRTSGGTFSVSSPAHFRMLRRVNGIYYRLLGEGKSDFAAIMQTARETGLSERKVEQMLIEGSAFRYSKELKDDGADAYDINYDDEELDGRDVDARYFTGCNASDPQQVYARETRHDEVTAAYEQLSYKEQSILCDAYGIECLYCGRTKLKKSHAEIAEDWELYSEDAVDKALKRSCGKIRRALSR